MTFCADGCKTATATVTVTKIPTQISVLNETISLKVGDELGELASLTPAEAGAVSYTGYNTSVVVIDGHCAAVGEGTTTITVSFAGNDDWRIKQLLL